jgi:hypothetical protein
MNDEAKALAVEHLKRDLQNLPTTRELAWKEIQNGVDPKWVAAKYLLPVESMLAARIEHDRREQERQESKRV